jgi:hypothetical protein
MPTAQFRLCSMGFFIWLFSNLISETLCSHSNVYCHVSGVPWLIITGSGLDDWTYWQRLVQSLLTIDYNSSQSIFGRTLFLWLPRTHSILVLLLSNWTTLTLMSSRHGPCTENIALLLLRACLLGFTRDRYPASPLARRLIRSNSLDVNHIENIVPVLLAACLFERVYLVTGFSGSIA